MLDFILDLDWKIFYLINSVWTSPWADAFFPGVTDLHKTAVFKFFMIPMILLLFILRRGLKRGFTIFIFCILTILISDGIGNHAFKKTIQRPRPGHTEGLTVVARAPFGGYSFVSNHATNMFAFAAFVGASFPVIALPLYVLAATIGYSRIYSGVHFPTDVIAGALLGILIGLFMFKICKYILKKTNSISVVGS